MTFGQVSRFFSRLKAKYAEGICAYFDLTKNELLVLKSWIKLLLNLRNSCAHNERLYKVNLKDSAKILKRNNLTFDNRYSLQSVITILCELLPVEERNCFHQKF